MEQALRARTAARGWATRVSRELSKVCDGDPDKVSLTVAIEDFHKRLEALDTAQTDVENNINLEKLEEDLEAAADFRQQVRLPLIRAAQLLDRLNAADEDKGSVHSSASESIQSVKMAKLPKIELPKFTGDVTEWQSFWDKFVAIIDTSDLPDISKFTYLQSLLDGEAKSAIHGLSTTSDHYKIACKILCERFGRKERIIFTHIQELLNLSVPTSAKQSKISILWKLQDDLQAHVRSLKALGIDGSQYGVILTPLILSRLPQDIRMEWAREGEGRENDLAWLLEFLHREIKRRERSQTFKDNSTSTLKPVHEERKSKFPTVAALQTNSSVTCGFCGKRHPTDQCWEVTKLPFEEKRDRIRAARLCFKCLQKNHIAKGCMAKCGKCRGNHHALCCLGGNGKKTLSESSSNAQNGQSKTEDTQEHTTMPNANVSVTTVAQTGSKRSSLLQMAKVSIIGHCGVTTATVLFDSGSDRSYITSSLVRDIEPEYVGAQPVSYVSFGKEKAGNGVFRNIFRLNLQGIHGEKESFLVTEIPVICAPMFRTEVPSDMLQAFGNLSFVDNYGDGEQVQVDILIGLDYYWNFVNASKTVQIGGLVAQETLFGWILSGSWLNEKRDSSVCVVHQLLCFSDIPEATLRRFWDLESIGISPKENETADPVLDRFLETVSFKDGRYVVELPWKDPEHNRLLDNKKLAQVRLDNLSRRFAKDPGLQERYDKVLCEMEDNGVIHEVPKEELISSYPTYYMPHRPVVREASTSTKVRPVFDASAPGYNGVSLNDCLETGPSLIPNLAEILIRFRRHKVAMIADITKAFLQIQVRKEDQDVHRFLWNQNGVIRIMRFARVPFGNKSSPFLLNATIKHHLSKFPSTRVIKELQDNLYVDDWLTGADSESEACRMFTEARSVMLKAKMSLAKWESESVKVLGMKWLPSIDCFSFDGLEIPDGLKVTKRTILSFIARLFDPLGVLTAIHHAG